MADGRRFESETDTEVVAHLVTRELEQGATPQEAVARTLKRIHGAFSLAILFRRYPDMLIGARLGSPLVVGYGDGETYLGSDALALAPLTQRISYLEEGDWVVIDARPGPGLRPRRQAGRPARSSIPAPPRRGSRRAITATSCSRRSSSSRSSSPRPWAPICARSSRRWRCPTSASSLADVPRVTIVACGTSFYAGMVAKYWFEQFARVPVELDIASEFRYRAAGAGAGRARPVHLAVGRDRRHARRAAPRPRRGPEDRRRRQRADQLDGARGGPAAPHPCRAGDRRRLHQGLHLPARRARRARRQDGARQGPDERGGGARDRRASRGSAGGDERRARP